MEQITESAPIAAIVRYHKINRNNDQFADVQLVPPDPPPPYKPFVLTVTLFVSGTILLVIGCLLATGGFGVKYVDGAYPLIILGPLLYIPGLYHARIAWFEWRRYKRFVNHDPGPMYG